MAFPWGPFTSPPWAASVRCGRRTPMGGSLWTEWRRGKGSKKVLIYSIFLWTGILLSETSRYLSLPFPSACFCLFLNTLNFIQSPLIWETAPQASRRTLKMYPFLIFLCSSPLLHRQPSSIESKSINLTTAFPIVCGPQLVHKKYLFILTQKTLIRYTIQDNVLASLSI